MIFRCFRILRGDSDPGPGRVDEGGAAGGGRVDLGRAHVAGVSPPGRCHPTAHRDGANLVTKPDHATRYWRLLRASVPLLLACCQPMFSLRRCRVRDDCGVLCGWGFVGQSFCIND